MSYDDPPYDADAPIEPVPADAERFRGQVDVHIGIQRGQRAAHELALLPVPAQTANQLHRVRQRFA